MQGTLSDNSCACQKRIIQFVPDSGSHNGLPEGLTDHSYLTEDEERLSFETPANIYQPTWRNILELLNSVRFVFITDICI
jgi:hypothetical protein